MKRHIEKRIASEYQQRRLLSEDQASERRFWYLNKYPDLKKIEDDLTGENARISLQIISDGKLREGSVRRNEILAQRDKYLLENGIPSDYDAPRYTCVKCNDTGLDPFAADGKCSCYLELLVPMLYEYSNFPGLAAYSFKTFDPVLFSNEHNEETYRSKNSPREQIAAIKIESEKFVKNFTDSEDVGLFFVGSPGTGKTYMAGCIANSLISQGIPVLYHSAPEMFDIINEYRIVSTSFSPDKERLEKALEAYESILNTDLLIIDDLGTETFNSNRQPELLAVINHRAGNLKKMIITTNLSMSDLMNFYDERLISRISGGFSVYKFFGSDLRFTKKKLS